MTPGVPPGLEMIADPHGIEPQRFGGHTKVQEFAWAELFCRRLVAQSNQ
jgi:hypothetical protein